MTADNRTNEPKPNETKSGQAFGFTEAQVEAAAKALREMRNFDEGVSSTLLDSWSRMVATAALVAAQGAAPQAECTEAPGGRPCEASKPGHKLHYSNGEARGE